MLQNKRSLNTERYRFSFLNSDGDMKGRYKRFRPNTVQHVYQRTVKGHLLFYTIKDYLVFYTILSIIARKYGVQILGICLMVDHIFHDRHKALHRHGLDTLRVIAVIRSDIHKSIIHVRIIGRNKRTAASVVDIQGQDVLDNKSSEIIEFCIRRCHQLINGDTLFVWKSNGQFRKKRFG